MKILPETRFGKWAICLAAFFILAIAVAFAEAIYFSETSGILVVALVIAGGIAGVSAAVIGFISVLKKQERSPLVFLSLPVGLSALLLLGFLIWRTFFAVSIPAEMYF